MLLPPYKQPDMLQIFHSNHLKNVHDVTGQSSTGLVWGWVLKWNLPKRSGVLQNYTWSLISVTAQLKTVVFFQTWTRELCMMDSDGDGRTNGEELGDPRCVWTPRGGAPTNTASGHPGKKKSWGFYVIISSLRVGCIKRPYSKILPRPYDKNVLPLEKTRCVKYYEIRINCTGSTRTMKI